MQSSVLVTFLFILICSLETQADVLSDQWSALWTNSAKSDGKKRNRSHSSSSIVSSSDLHSKDRRIWVITTACLPWMTGTSINPLLRAAYLAKDRPAGMITLMVPWVTKEDQDILYPANIRFDTPEEQRAYVKNWLIKEAHMSESAEKLDIVFYAGRFHDEFHSVFPMGDLTELIPDDQADVQHPGGLIKEPMLYVINQ
eukprot:gene13455-28520_t